MGKKGSEWGVMLCIGFPLDRCTCMCFSELCSCVRGVWCEGRGVALSSSITTTRELRKAATEIKNQSEKQLQKLCMTRNPLSYNFPIAVCDGSSARDRPQDPS